MNRGAWFAGENARFVIFASAFFVLWFLGLYLVFAPDGISEREEHYIYVLFFLAAPLCGGLGILWKTLRSHPDDRWPFGPAATAILGVGLPLAVLGWGFIGIDIVLYHAEYEKPAPSPFRFILGMCLALAACVATILIGKSAARRHSAAASGRASKIRLAAYAAGFIALASLFDVNITLDTLSYGPYVGPAAAVLNGAIPLVDVFSQYGLNFLLFAAVLKVLPWSMFSTTLFVASLNIVYYGVVCVIVYRVTTNRLLCFLVSVFVVMFLHAASLYNITYTPSVLAMRFLPPLLLLASLTSLRGGRLFNGWTAAATALCAVWSIEALAFGGLTYATYLTIIAIAHRRDGLKRPALALAGVAACVVVPHVVLSLGYLAAFGTFPRYDIYWEYIAGDSTAQAQEWKWLLPVSPNTRAWILFGFSYALGSACAMFGAWRALEKSQDPSPLAFVAAVCALGAVQFSYYLGRSATPVLVFLAFPLAILFILVIDNAWRAVLTQDAQPAAFRAVGALAVVLLVGMGGVFVDRIFRPIAVTGSNSTLLRSCLAAREARVCSPRRVLAKIRDKIREPAGFPTNEGAGWSTVDENRAAYDLVRKYQAGEPRVLLFITDAAAVLFLTKKVDLLGFAHAMVDGRSPTLVARARKKLESVPEGAVVIVGDTRPSQSDREMLAELRRRWELCPLETRDIVTAYRLARKSCPSGDGNQR